MDAGLVLAMEEALLATFPPLHTELKDGLFVGAAKGVTGRANSAVVLGHLGDDITHAVTWVEQWYAKHSLGATFRLSPLAPADLQAHLTEAGYQGRGTNASLTTAMRSQLPGRSFPFPDTVEITADRPADWSAVSERSTADHDVIALMLSMAPVQSAWAVHREGGQPVAAGRGVLAQGWLSVQAMFTQPDRRGQGLAGLVLQALHAWAIREGAHESQLNVMASNQAALSLYARHSYEPVYQYTYMVRNP